MIDLESLTKSVCQIARQAGAYIRNERLKFSVESVERKHAHDYVSYVDKGSEQLIVSQLHALLPEAGFITEEGTTQSDSSSPLTSDLTWVVDPLDGTTNFIHQYAPYAVSIGLLQGTTVLVGVVYEICADECYFAWKGGGAFMEFRDESSELSLSMSAPVPSRTRCSACSCPTTATPTSPSSVISSTPSTAVLPAFA